MFVGVTIMFHKKIEFPKMDKQIGTEWDEYIDSHNEEIQTWLTRK